MQLQQLNLSYEPDQDRLLLRISTAERLEVRLWLTRRLVHALWPGLLQLMGQSPLARRAAGGAREQLVAFQHEQAIRASDFARPYTEEPLAPALPGDPVLVCRVQLRAGADGAHHLALLPKAGPGFELRMTETLLHGFARLLQDTAGATGWDLPLQLPAAAAADPRPN